MLFHGHFCTSKENQGFPDDFWFVFDFVFMAGFRINRIYKKDGEAELWADSAVVMVWSGYEPQQNAAEGKFAELHFVIANGMYAA